MQFLLLVVGVTMLFLESSAVAAKRSDRRSFPGAVTETFKHGDDHRLLIHIFHPPGHRPDSR